MARRMTWFTAGLAAGAVGAIWGLSAARRTSERLQPERIGSDVVDSLRDLGTDVRAAFAEGRVAMRERERELLAGRQQRSSPDEALTGGPGPLR